MKPESKARLTDGRGGLKQRSCAGCPLVRAALLTLSVFVFPLSPLLHAAPTLTASVEPGQIRPGSFANYMITIEGGQPDSASELNLPPGVELAAASPSFGQQTTIINGHVRQFATLTWQITSSTPGEHVIPPQELHVGGVPYRTNETRLIVKDSPASPASQTDPIMTLEAAKREFYVGEVVPITVNLYVHRRTLLRRVGLIEIPKDNFAIQRFPLQAEESAVMMGGISYRALAYQSTLSALKPGKFKLGPASSELILEVEVLGPDGRFGHPFFSQTEPRKLRIQSGNEIEITVLPLPSEGRPKGFTGAVGDFDISMTAEPRELAIGDPISVELTISGTGNFDALTAPTLTDAEPWKLYPPRRYGVQSTDTPADGQVQRIGFTQVLIPKKKVATLPPFEFSYFSPSKKKYLTVRTDPVPLQMKAAEASVEPPPAVAAKGGVKSASDIQAEAVPPVKPNITDILTVLPKESTWLAARPALLRDRSFLTANLAAAGVLALLLIGKLGFAAWRAHHQSTNAPAHKLWRQLHSPHLTTAQFYSLAAGYIAAQGLEGDAIQSILDRHHAVNYGRPTGEEQKPVPREEREAVLHALKGR